MFRFVMEVVLCVCGFFENQGMNSSVLDVYGSVEEICGCVRNFASEFYRWVLVLKGELQRESKLISYERAFKMLENDMYIAGVGQAVLELLSFKVESGNHQRGISLLQKFSDIFGNMRLVLLKMTSHLTSHNFQILKIEIFSKLCKI